MTSAQTIAGNELGRAKLADRKDDLYESPPGVIEALLEVEKLPQTVWEPACGRGALVRPLRAAGRVVYATDLVDYDVPDQDEARWDFLFERQVPIGVEAIITNPPFKNAIAFVRHALQLCDRVVMFLPFSFYEGTTRDDVLEAEAGLAQIHVFKNRVPMMHRDGYVGPKIDKNRKVFAWFVWDLRTPIEDRQTMIDRILCKDPDER